MKYAIEEHLENDLNILLDKWENDNSLSSNKKRIINTMIEILENEGYEIEVL